MGRLLAALVSLAVLAVIASLILFAPRRGVSGAGSAARTQVMPTAAVAEPPSGTAVFEMKYRGLTTPDDPLSYRSYWGFGTPDETTAQNDPFVRAVRSRVKDCSIVENPYLLKARYSAVELKDNEPVAYYFDLNADGQLAEDERFPPAASTGPRVAYPYAFITSDFMIRTKDQREVPFRIMVVGFGTGSERIAFMGSPCCVLEGQATLAGRPMTLVLYANGFQGSFTDFGACSFALIPAERKSEGYTPRSTLSSLICHEGVFYRLKLQGTHTRDRTVRVVLEKDTSPTGRTAIELAGAAGMKTRLSELRLQGAPDANIQFQMPDAQPALPIGQYKLSYGYAFYGTESSNEWNVDFNAGPQFDVKTAETTRLDLGTPVLSVRAIDEKDRYEDNAKERTAYARGASIYLSPQIKGKAGEVYMRFSRKNAGTNNFTDVTPHIAIVDSGGKQVVSADMEYG